MAQCNVKIYRYYVKNNVEREVLVDCFPVSRTCIL